MPALKHLPSPVRDRGLDSLRGLMLIGMAVNHIASQLQIVTDHPLGYTSMAEGFVFLSGLVAGLVYTRRRQRLGMAEATRASCRRATTIYRYHAVLFIGVWTWAHVYFGLVHAPAGNTPASMLQHPALSLLAGLLLVNQPGLLDILPMYAGFMLLLPTVLAELDAGHRGRVLAFSFAGWVVTNLCWPGVPVEIGVLRMGAFNWGAWQFLFLVGAVCGHARATGVKLLPRHKIWLVIPAIALCAWCFMIRHWYWPAPFASFADWVNKNNLAPVRLLNTFALFLLVHLAFVRWPRAFTWRPLALLGRHSLAVFSTHIGVAYLLFAFPQFVATSPARTWIGTTVMIASLFAVAVWRERARPTVAVARRPAEARWRRAA